MMPLPTNVCCALWSLVSDMEGPFQLGLFLWGHDANPLFYHNPHLFSWLWFSCEMKSESRMWHGRKAKPKLEHHGWTSNRDLKHPKSEPALPGQGRSSEALGGSLRCSGSTLWFHLFWIKLIEIQSPSQHTTFPLVRSEVWKPCFAFSVGCPARGLKCDRLWRFGVTGNFNIPLAQSSRGIREIENEEL